MKQPCITLVFFILIILLTTVTLHFVEAEKRKHTHGKFSGSEETHTIPQPLTQAFESIVLERQELGEENDVSFLETTLLELIDVWNSNIDQLRNDFAQSIGMKVLKDIDAQPASVVQQDSSLCSSMMEQALTEALQNMPKVMISRVPKAIKLLS